MSKTTTSYHEGLIKDLANPAEAAAYLNVALEDGSQEIFLMALRDIADAKGMALLSKKAHLNRVSLYRMLSGNGNPELSSLTTILKNVGLRLAVEVREPTLA
ncbi:MAG: addiction module antidote protein [Kiritimatiellia bacterium]